MNFTVGHVYRIHCGWIDPPHTKISLCISCEPFWFFWFNSKVAFHGVAQLEAKAGCHASISKDCYLDLSGVKVFSPDDLATAIDQGPIDPPLLDAILNVLNGAPSRLPQRHKDLALENLRQSLIKS
jgi:hypothetical protein